MNLWHAGAQLFVLALLFGLSGCGGGGGGSGTSYDSGVHFEPDPADHVVRCPLLSDNVTWTSIGSWKLRLIGGEETAEYLQDECNWWDYTSYEGPRGRVLVLASSGGDIVFEWVKNRFERFTVQGAWSGLTPTNLHLGQSLSGRYDLLLNDDLNEDGDGVVYFLTDQHTRVDIWLDGYIITRIDVGY